jgi:hypothetical protein
MSNGERFDPSQYITKISGKDYLETKYRLLWLRTEYPEAQVETKLEHLDEGPGRAGKGQLSPRAIFSARVTLPNGASATGWGSETMSDFPDFIEKAECVPTTVMAIGKHGPLRYDQIHEGTPILAVDLEQMCLVWAPVRRVAVYEQAPIVRFKAGWMRFACTPDHKWPIRRARNGGSGRAMWMDKLPAVELEPIMKIPLDARFIFGSYIAVPPDGPAVNITDKEATLLGFFLRFGMIWRKDGRVRPNAFVSERNDRELVDGYIIRELCHRFEIPASEAVLLDGDTEIRFSRNTRVGYTYPVPEMEDLLERAGLADAWPDWRNAVLSLPARMRPSQRTAMMHGMSLWRCTDEDRQRCRLIMTGRSEWQRTLWAMLVALNCGGPVRSFCPGSGRTALAIGSFSASARHMERTVVAEPEPVWCPDTGYGTFVAFEGDLLQVYTTGNTRALGRALAALGFGTQFSGHEWGGETEYDAPVDSPVERRPSPVPISAYRQGGQGSDSPPTPAQLAYARDLLGRIGHDPEGYNLEGMSRVEISAFIEQLKEEAATRAKAKGGGRIAEEAIAANAIAKLRNKDIEGFSAIVRKAVADGRTGALMAIIEQAPSPDVVDLIGTIVVEENGFTSEIDKALQRRMEVFISADEQ